jgi:hypothetical protein
MQPLPPEPTMRAAVRLSYANALQPPIAQERLKLLPDNLVRIDLKRLFSDATVAVNLDPFSLLCRLAASVSYTPGLGLARTLSPCDSGMWSMLLMTALAHFAAGRYAECTQWAERAIGCRPQIPINYAALAAAQAHLGETQKAKATIARMQRKDGAMRLSGFENVIRITDRELSTRFLDGLRLAGLAQD